MKSNALHNAISSQGLGDGVSPCASQDGPTTSQCGQAAAPANHSVPRVSKKVKQTTGICGPYGIGSSRSAGLQSSLESRLHKLLPMVGGTKRPLIWKEKVTPAGRRYCQLTVSVRSTKETDYGSLRSIPTPTASDHKGGSIRRYGRGAYNNLRDWFSHNYNFLYPPVKAVAWLMGYSTEHLSSMRSAMLSFRRSPRRLLNPIDKYL